MYPDLSMLNFYDQTIEIPALDISLQRKRAAYLWANIYFAKKKLFEA